MCGVVSTEESIASDRRFGVILARLAGELTAVRVDGLAQAIVSVLATAVGGRPMDGYFGLRHGPSILAVDRGHVA